MREFEGKICECCKEPFRAEDEIVVCPDCGTPIHRKCWDGHCPNEAKHAEGYDWEAEHIRSEKPKVDSSAAEVCAICGLPLSEEETVVCPDCGTPMHRACYEREGRCPNEPRHAYGYVYRSDRGQPVTIPMPQSFEDYIQKVQEREKERGTERTCFGVNHAELVHFLGVHNLSTPRFYSLFFHMADTGRKVSFNFLAGLLMPFYQLYRKMTGPSIVLLLLFFIANIPQMIAQALLWTHQSTTAVPAELFTLIEYFSYAYLVIRVLVILFNDYIFMRWSVGRILAIREQYRNAPEAEYMAALERAGKPKLSFAAMGLLAFSALMYLLLALFLGGSFGTAS